MEIIKYKFLDKVYENFGACAVYKFTLHSIKS